MRISLSLSLSHTHTTHTHTQVDEGFYAAVAVEVVASEAFADESVRELTRSGIDRFLNEIEGILQLAPPAAAIGLSINSSSEVVLVEGGQERGEVGVEVLVGPRVVTDGKPFLLTIPARGAGNVGQARVAARVFEEVGALLALLKPPREMDPQAFHQPGVEHRAISITVRTHAPPLCF